MKADLGPLDRRLQKSRCSACIDRHSKCSGRFPCDGCLRRGLVCLSPAARSRRAIFRFEGQPSPQSCEAAFQHLPCSSAGTLTALNIQDVSTAHISHFFTFLEINSFTGVSQNQYRDVQKHLCRFSSLFNATRALGGLDVARRALTSNPDKRQTSARLALEWYSLAIRGIEKELAGKFLENDGLLWSSFFVGIFELMCDQSGTGWLKHMMYGTSKIIQLRGPDRHLRGSGREFFLTFRVFEVCRALIYATDTFLSEKQWRDFMVRLSVEDHLGWHPKEAMFDLMILVSELSNRAWNLVMDKIEHQSLSPEVQPGIEAVAVEGLRLQQSIYDWYSKTLVWASAHPRPSGDDQLTLAFIYYHAIMIFHSGTFDYHPCWANVNRAPRLSIEEVHDHFAAILKLTTLSLERTNLAGVVYFLPLRIAGARVKERKDQDQILEMLREIAGRGYVVAEAFVQDLEALWQR